MADVLPINFPIPAENMVASYDWFDFATGAGYKKFYFIGGKNSVGNQYILSTSIIDADQENSSSGGLGTSTTTWTWDITFSRPVVIAAADAFYKHEAYISAAAATNYMGVEVFHVRGGVETSIGSGTGDAMTSGAAATHSKMMKFSVSKKAFGIGDTLRVKTTFYATNNFNTTYFDPSSSGYEMYILLPFEVEL